MARVRYANDEAVLAVLQDADTPLTAYQVLAALRDQGVQSPPVVYRALERLERSGAVHRIEQLNAYFVCPGPHIGEGVVLAVCTACRKVEEWPADATLRWLDDEARRRGFRPAQKVFELRGRCRTCEQAEPAEPMPPHVHGPDCDHDHSH